MPLSNPPGTGATTAFPTSLDTLPNSAAVAALEARVGVTGSGVSTSLTNRIAVLEAAGYVEHGLTSTLTSTSFTSFHRAMSQTATSLQSQRLQITGFTSPLSFTSSTATIYVNGTGTTSTGSFLGLWSMDGADAGTLIASTANDTALFTVANARSKAWQVAVALTAGTRYAFGVLQNGGSLPTLATLSSSGGLLKFVTPLQAGYRDSQTSMAAFTKANLTAGTDYFYFELS